MEKSVRKLKNRRGQSMTEYALVLAFVIAFLYAIRGYFTTHMSGTITAGVDSYVNTVNTQIGSTVANYAPTTTSNQNSTSGMTYQGTGAINTTSNSKSNQNSTSTF